MEPISSWTDPAIRALERSDVLNAMGKWVSNTFHRLVGTGRAKEALAGSWMAHPALPMLTVASFHEGHLSFRKGVGVDQTAFDPPIEDWTAAIAMDELKDGQPRRVMVAGRNLFLLRRGERVHALANRCTHRGGPLHKG